MSKTIRPRITDVDVKPPRPIDATDIAADTERFLAAGGQIQKPAFRRDECERANGPQEPRTRRRWKKTPPDLKHCLRGVSSVEV
jgi:hypothetical protein